MNNFYTLRTSGASLKKPPEATYVTKDGVKLNVLLHAQLIASGKAKPSTLESARSALARYRNQRAASV